MDVPGLSAVAELGEFFALPVADESWLPIASLVDDAAMLNEYSIRAQAAIAGAMGVSTKVVPLKAAASSLHLSIAARLLSPAIGAAVCFDSVPLLTAESLFWQPTSTHKPSLGATQVEWVAAADPQQAAHAIARSLIERVLSPLNDTMRQAVSLSPQVLWGNIASAANGAVTVLALSRPAAEARGRAVIRALIADPSLSDAAEIVDGTFRRRNCCLYYQVPGGGYCGDCVLV